MVDVLASEGVTDPVAWGQALRDLGAVGAVLLVVFFFCATIMLIWRGSKKLDIVGVGTEIRDELRAGAEALAKVGAVMDRVSSVLDRLERSGRLPQPSVRPAPDEEPDEEEGPALAGPTSRRPARGKQPSRPQ